MVPSFALVAVTPLPLSRCALTPPLGAGVHDFLHGGPPGLPHRQPRSGRRGESHTEVHEAPEIVLLEGVNGIEAGQATSNVLCRVPLTKVHFDSAFHGLAAVGMSPQSQL